MKSWYARVLGTLLASAYFLHYVLTQNEWHFIDGVNLIFHEAGHVIFMFFGTFMHVLMGSGLQVLLPLGIAAYFYTTRQWLSSAVCLMWAGQNVINVSIYAGDSVAMQLPLLGGDPSGHDWHYLLGTLGILNWTAGVAAAFNAAGLSIMFAGFALAYLLLLKEYKKV